jgi:P4 family phage/plasmid primase-like protien
MDDLLPKQLRNPEYRFALVKRGTKNPYEKAWQKNGYRFDDPKLVGHLQTEKNYAIIGGYGNLIFTDFDDMDVYNEVKDNLPKTFSVKTGTGKPHLYYEVINGNDSFKILQEVTGKTLVDIQGKGKVVIGAGSIHPNGNIYTVLDDIPITKIDYRELEAVFIKYRKPPEMERVVATNYGNYDRTLIEKIKSTITVPDYLSKLGIPTNKNPTQCPFHSSQGGKCLSFTDQVFYCWHCSLAGDLFTLVMRQNNCCFKEALQIICKENGFEKEYEEYIAKSFQFSRRDYSELQNEIRGIHDNEEWSDATKKSLITECLVNAVKEERKFYTTRDDISAEVWVYNEGIYIPHGRTFVKEFCRLVLGAGYILSIADRVIAKIETDTYIDQKTFFNNNIIEEVAVENGILNIFDRKLSPFTPNKIFFNKLPVTYDPSKDCPVIKQHFANVLQSIDDVKVMQEIFGYALYKEYKFEKAFLFIGSGRNAKSKSQELLKRFVGVENCSNVTLQQMETEPFVICELFGKMVNMSGDLPAKALETTGNFKSLTGRDEIMGQRKFRSPIGFVNYAKCLFSANEIPYTRDMTPAFLNRWIILEFPYTFLTEAEAKLESGRDLKVKIADNSIIDKITTPDEMSGLLNWALDGLNRLLTNKAFSYSKSMEETKNLWLRKSDSFSGFCLDKLVTEYGHRILKSELRHEYHKYCVDNGLRPVSDKKVGWVLTSLFGAYGEKVNEWNANGINKDSVYYWNGIAYKSTEQQKVLNGTDMLNSFVNEEVVEV